MSLNLSAMQIEGREEHIAVKPPDRRLRPRVRISAPVRVRSKHATLDLPMEICMTLDASRAGLYFTTEKNAYVRGLDLVVTFPYFDVPGASNMEQACVVARVDLLPEDRFGIAVEFTQDRCAAPAPERSRRLRGREVDPAANLRGPLVLAVENDGRARTMLRGTLEGAGYEVTAVSSGAEALLALRGQVPAVVVAEIESDLMSGFDLCDVVKKDSYLQDVPIVLVTRDAMPSQYSTAHRLGATICMAKPYQQKSLLHVVGLLAPPPVKVKIPRR
jgi:two-component system, chemotaxis family, chemotaxis protein CheY